MKGKKRPSRENNRETDARVEKSKEAVLKTTYELLTKSGLSGVSVDEVSRRSGVAKTTIYRHWPSRESLLMDACSQLSQKPQLPDTGSMRKDLEMLARGMAARLREPWSTVLPSIIDGAERSKDLATLHSKIHAQMRNALLTALERGQQRGELPSSHEPREIVASIMGPLLYRRYFSRETVDEAFALRVVDRALRGCT